MGFKLTTQPNPANKKKTKNHIPMNSKVQSHQFCELRVVEAQHVAVVGGPVLVVVDGADTLAVAVGVAVDGGGYDGQLGDQVH